MCTSIALTSKDFYFGRNLDLEYHFGERVVVTPHNYPVRLRMAGELSTHHAMIGMATVADGYPLYAEAVNEKGLCIAGLNFPGNAYYPTHTDEAKANISPFELPLWVLGQCETVMQAWTLLERTHLIAIDHSPSMRLSPLHWHIADRERSIVLESMQDGMHLYDDPVGVLTNNPPFDFQLTNLRQYLNLTAAYPTDRFGGAHALSPFGQGFGAIGLPGDYSPVSRFVKAAFLRQNSICDMEDAASVAQFFHLLDAVAMPRGSVRTQEEKYDITTYSCCVNATQGVYYYKTYENDQLTAVDMHRAELNGTAIYEYPLVTEQQVAFAN